MAVEDNDARHKRFRSIYSSDLGHDIVNEFLVPALENAVQYKRVTGDFSSAFLVAAARGLGPFFLDGGRMQLITNGRFSETDLEAIKSGVGIQDVLEKSLSRELELMREMVSYFETEHIRALTWLLKSGRLDLRVSLLKGPDGQPLPATNPIGAQHSKVGIIRTQMGDKIAFIGGLNESMRAYLGNAESLQASYSWIAGDLSDISDIEGIFDALWSNRSPKSETLQLPEAIRQKLIATYDATGIPDLSIWAKGASRPGVISPPWPHQKEALDTFLTSKTGILEMATGTGKTRVAMLIISRLLQLGEIKGVVVATRWNDLLDQWYRQLLEFFLPSKLLVVQHYGQHRDMNTFLQLVGTRPIALLTSYANLADLLDRDRSNQLSSCLLICDEIHNIGSVGNVQALHEKLGRFVWRLGLSATPEREYDEAGNVFIDTEVGPVIYRFGVDDAIKNGILCEFDYAPLFYEFNAEDRARMRDVYAAFSARKNTPDPMTKEELYLELSKVRKLSKNKLPVFRDFLRDHPQSLKRCLIFVETKEYGQMVQEVIHPLSMDYHTYYGDDETENLARFSKAELDCLLTCKRISEGIDIRSVSNVILFSCSRARLETIQRIGRALRVMPGNPNKRALVVDFIREGDLHREGDESEVEPVDLLRYEWLTGLSKIHRRRDESHA